MSISLEAREILNHLNSLGYRNISSAQLKEFMSGKLYKESRQILQKIY